MSQSFVSRYLLPLTLGSVGGFLVSEFMHDEREPAAPAERVAVFQADEQPSAQILERLEALERRAAQAKPASVATSAEQHAADIVSPEAMPSEADEERHFANLVHEAQSEPRDARWAHDIENTVSSDLTSIGVARGFSVADSRCGTSQCVFELAWANVASTDDVSALLHADLGVNCPRTVHVPSAPDGQRKRGVVLLSCAN